MLNHTPELWANYGRTPGRALRAIRRAARRLPVPYDGGAGSRSVVYASGVLGSQHLGHFLSEEAAEAYVASGAAGDFGLGDWHVAQED